MRRFLMLAAGLGLMALAPLSASAQTGLTLKVDDVLAAPGTTGSFDVYFLEPVPDAGSEQLGAYNITVDVTPAPGASILTITSTSRTDGLHPPVLGTGGSFTSSGSDTDSGAGSADVASGSEQDIDNLEGVLRVFYSVGASATASSFTLSINPVTEFTNGVTGNPIPFTPLNGTFTIAPVPEPTGLAVAGVIGGMALLRRRRRAC